MILAASPSGLHDGRAIAFDDLPQFFFLHRPGRRKRIAQFAQEIRGKERQVQATVQRIDGCVTVRSGARWP